MKSLMTNALRLCASLIFFEILSTTVPSNAQNLQNTVEAETSITVAQNYPEIKGSSPDNLPACVIQTQNGRLLDLSSICGHKKDSANSTQQTLTSINLDQDSNRDGIPDQLAEAIKRVENADDKDAAIKDLVNRLPYSEQTRSLQQQTGNLSQQLANARTESEAQQIISQIKSAQEKMIADPNYAKTQDAMLRLFSPKADPFMLSPQAKNKAIVGKGSDDSSTEKSDDSIAVNWNGLRKGDIMLVRTSWLVWSQFFYSMWYTHSGNYADNNQVLEANTNDGVNLRSLSEWKQKGQYVAIGYNNKKWNNAPAALDSAKNKWNRKRSYNYLFADKWTQDRFYCSQLSWRIHNDIGVNLDSNNWAYRLYIASIWGSWTYALTWAAVTPDEIAASGNLTIYSKSWN